MIFLYFIAISFGLFAIGIAGVAATKHFVLMMLGIEIAFTASLVLAASSFSYAAPGNVIGLAFTIWTLASAEIIGMVAVYRFMMANGIEMDVSKLSKLRDW